MDRIESSIHADMPLTGTAADALLLGSSASAATPLPLCVDLDGTLVKSDTLADSLCGLARNSPLGWLLSPIWLARGKAGFKQAVTSRVELDPAHLPYNEALVVYLREEAARGRPIYLATGADRKLADSIAGHLGIFDGVLASDGATNLTGSRKLLAVEERFGRGGYDYVGNGYADVPMLAAAAHAMLANPSRGLAGRLRRRQVAIAQEFCDRPPVLRSVLRELRMHQWAKNTLVFLPVLLAHATGSGALVQALLAFVCFCLAASATYVLNDLLDLGADRRHVTKRNRPFAAGNLSAAFGIVLAATLLTCGLWGASRLAQEFLVWLAIYCVVTLAYSMYFKRIVIVDVIILSALYTLRILSGAAAAHVGISSWMAGFSIFFFFSLALVKRFSELQNLQARGAIPANERGYHVQDLDQLRAFGTASAYASVVVFALYINNPEVRELYHHPQRLWLMTPLLLWWLSRVWLRASRGQMHEDPVVFALTDGASLVAGVATFLIALSAL